MNNEQMEQFKAAKRAGLNPKWYYHDFESGKDVIEYDIPKLLRVARVVKAWINLYNDGPLPNFASWREAEKEIEAALKEVEHLL